MMSEPRLELRLGAPVAATDGTVGHLRQIMFDPQQQRVAALGIRRRMFPPHDSIIPLAHVAAADDQAVRLSCTRTELEQPFAVPATELQILRHGLPVHSTAGRAGRLERLLVSPAGDLQHLVIRQNNPLRPDLLVPANLVQQIDERGIRLTATQTEVDKLEIYRRDQAIRDDVERTLWEHAPVRTHDSYTIGVTVSGGHVVLRGHTRTTADQMQAEQVARAVPGVRSVTNAIIADGELVNAVAQALANDSRLHGLRVFVRVAYGIVTLGGEVPTAEARNAAGEATAGVPGVRGIINEVRAPGVVFDPWAQRVLQPRIGQSVYANSIPLGQVERLVIDPADRGVRELVVAARLSNRERHMLLPIRAVEDVTNGGVFLNSDVQTVAEYGDFDPAQFAVPAPDWQPPFPYTTADVLIRQEPVTTVQWEPEAIAA
ncbi:MAG: BON domain-containing protein [Chloroflexaceae bacterium]